MTVTDNEEHLIANKLRKIEIYIVINLIATCTLLGIVLSKIF